MSGARVAIRLTVQDRTDRIKRILAICREKNWTIDTPDIAGKLYNILKSSPFTRDTIRDYVVAIIDILSWEKKHHRPYEFSPANASEKPQLLKWSTIGSIQDSTRVAT